MRYHKSLAADSSAALLLTGCANTPAGPMVRVMPSPELFEVFVKNRSIASIMPAIKSPAALNRALGATARGAVLGLGVGAATGSDQQIGSGEIRRECDVT